MVKTKDKKNEEGKRASRSCQPDTSTQNKNTKTNNEKPSTDCTEHQRKIILVRNQSNPTNQPLKPIKVPEKKSPVKLNDRPRKIKLNLTPNRFEGLQVMDIAEKKSETNKPTKQKSLKDKT